MRRKINVFRANGSFRFAISAHGMNLHSIEDDSQAKCDASLIFPLDRTVHDPQKIDKLPRRLIGMRTEEEFSRSNDVAGGHGRHSSSERAHKTQLQNQSTSKTHVNFLFSFFFSPPRSISFFETTTQIAKTIKIISEEEK